MRKVFVSLLLCCVLALNAVMPAAAVKDSAVSAPSAVLMETQTGKILFEKNAHERRPCASITKVMTLLLVFEAIESGKLSLDDTITASAHAASMGGSDIWLEEGEQMSADDMIKATVVASANDAAVALAEHLSGSEDAFVEQMNARAKELGMEETTFMNCNGLDEEGHLTSAYDVALMSRALMRHEKIYDYTSIWLDYLRGGETQIVNTNKLLKTYNGITGLKTGTTDDAGCCMAASAERDGMTLLAVVLGCDTGKQRFADAAALLDDGFANYSVKELNLPPDLPSELPVSGGMEKNVGISCEVKGSIVVDKASADEAQCQVNLPENAQAPVEEGEVLGEVVYTLGDEQRTFDILADSSVPATSFGRIFAALFNSLTAL
ncbi:MAG: D-alanyl-D-alanine carboxypeptidase [Ruminococcus sp.]|nr:D-alanyl-D-alanine carboxypeptidase [Ruminococcus sp.]